LLFTTQTLSDDEERALSRLSGVDEPAAYVHEHGERVGPETISVDGIDITVERIIEDEPLGACYGRVEPDPEPKWRDI
jgi:hypothetical protein